METSLQEVAVLSVLMKHRGAAGTAHSYSCGKKIVNSSFAKLMWIPAVPAKLAVRCILDALLALKPQSKLV